MPLWDKVKEELDRAGRVAQEALDEGRIRVELLRSRQLADKAAQRLGYAVAKARGAGGSDEAEVDRLHAALVEHEAEADRLQAQLDLITRRTHADDATAGATAAGMGGATGTTGGSAASTVDATDTIDFGGNSGASHRPDGSVDVGDATAAGGSTGHAGGASSTLDAPGAPPGERNEWNREHL
jgi:hypothetical protein